MSTAAYIVFIFSTVLVSTVTPLLFSKQRFKVTWWDYTFPLLGIPAWYVLEVLGIGEEISMNNFLFEMFIILVVSITIPWLRYSMRFLKARFISYIAFIITLLPLTTAVCLRLVMPFLPE